jgi:hypothetical protein
VEQHDGTWWFIDPRGTGFYATGVDHPNYNAHWCQELGYAPYHRNVEAAYGGEQAWADVVAGRLLQWGFNAVGWGHSPYLRHRRFAHVEMLGAGSGFVRFDSIVQRTTWTGFPNVFSPLWPRHCDQVATRVCAPNREDPWLLGYFLDNELEWHGKAWNDPFGLWTETWRRPDRHSAKRAWLGVVRKHCPTIEDANRALGTGFSSFDELAASTEPQPVRTGAARAMATEYVRLAADRYFRVAVEAIRRRDPNHLILGTRFPDWSPGVWDVCGRYCDVVSVNSYPRIDVDRGVPMDWVRRYRGVHEEAGKPLMFTEWSFPALDSGLPCTVGAGMRVATQAQRARCFSAFQRTLSGLPFVVGSTYFTYVDEPALGVSDTFPENTNYGLVNETDEPYAELAAAAAAVNPGACTIHLEGRLDDVYEPEPVAWDRRLPSQEAPAQPLTLSTGPLTLSPADGGLAWHLQRDGVPLGSYAPTVHQHDGQDHWTRPTDTRVTAVRADGHFTVVDMEFTHEAGAAAPPAYQAGWRFWVPRRSSGWFAAQSLWVRNSGARPWRLAGLFHYILPAVGGSSEDDVAAFAGVPNFYLDLAAWEDTRAGLGLGILAPYAGLSVTYWKDQNGFHSDCRQHLDVWLDPAVKYEAAGPLAVHFAYEAGGLPQLLATAEAVRREVAQLRRP